MENQLIEKEVKTKKENPWLIHVADVKKSNPDKSYKEVLQLAKETYTKVEKPVKEKKSKSPKKKDEVEI